MSGSDRIDDIQDRYIPPVRGAGHTLRHYADCVLSGLNSPRNILGYVGTCSSVRAIEKMMVRMREGGERRVAWAAPPRSGEVVVGERPCCSPTLPLSDTTTIVCPSPASAFELC